MRRDHLFSPFVILGTFFLFFGRAISQCPVNTTAVNLDLPQPVLSPMSLTTKVSGTLSQPLAGGHLVLCDGPNLVGQANAVAPSGAFDITLTARVLSGDKLQSQFISAAGVFGQPSTAVAAIESCRWDNAAPAAAPVPTINLTVDTAAQADYKGTATAGGQIRICVDDRPVSGLSPIGVAADGTYSGKNLALKAGDTVTAQTITSAAGAVPATFGMVSSDAVFSPPATTPRPPFRLAMIGGVEQSGFSSLTQSTDPFLQAFIAGEVWWARIRLLGAPQPSTQGIATLFTDPTGQLTSQDYSKVGEAVDFVLGPQWKITTPSAKAGGWSIVAGFGATTPLSSQTVTLTYKAPAPGTQECTTLVNRFTVANGYAPGLIAAPPGASTCLAGGYTDIAFSNQDRSSFLLKYGAGARLVGPCQTTDCSATFGVLDISVGQDEAITRGLLRHFVLKLDGFMPIPRTSNYLYLFGSAYFRFERNHNQEPLILTQETGSITIPSPTVIVLPLLQPDRDFYRLGVGISIDQLFCKLKDDCPATASK